MGLRGVTMKHVMHSNSKKEYLVHKQVGKVFFFILKVLF
jgi:hypothetical protein